MALQDILQHIKELTDEKIARAQAEHRQRVTELRSQEEREIDMELQSIARHKEQKMHQMRDMSKTHGTMLRRQTVLRKKQEWMAQIYDEVLKELEKMPEDKTEALLRACLKKIEGQGEIRAAKTHAALIKRLAPSEQFTMGEPVDAVGGFTFSSDTEFRDYTFDFLIREILKPQTEIETAQSLFSVVA